MRENSFSHFESSSIVLLFSLGSKHTKLLQQQQIYLKNSSGTDSSVLSTFRECEKTLIEFPTGRN